MSSNNELILHLGKNDKFIFPFIEFVERYCKPANHFYMFTPGIGADIPCQYKSKIYRSRSLIDNILLIYKINSANKIILHGLFNFNVIFWLVIMPWNINKCYWLVWGGDLYASAPKGIRKKFFFILKSYLIKRLGYIVTSISGDYFYAKSRFESKAFWLNYTYYPTAHLVLGSDYSSVPENRPINVLVGNSATQSNLHFQLIDKLNEIEDKNLKFFVPLTYGSEKYKKLVIAYGGKVLGSRFFPIEDHVDFIKYSEFLKSIDIALFNSERQQGMSTVRLLIGMGKTVYMNSKSSGYQQLRDFGIHVFDIDHVNSCFMFLNADQVASNIEIISNIYSFERLRSNLDAIF